MKRLCLLLVLPGLVCVCAFGRVPTIGREGDVPTKLLHTRFASAAFVAEGDADKLVVRGAWIQEGPPSQKITAAFMVIENHAAADISLVSAGTQRYLSDHAGTCLIHLFGMGAVVYAALVG